MNHDGTNTEMCDFDQDETREDGLEIRRERLKQSKNAEYSPTIANGGSTKMIGYFLVFLLLLYIGIWLAENT